MSNARAFPRNVIEAVAPPRGSWIVEINKARINLDYLRADQVWNRPSTANVNMPYPQREDRKNLYLVDLIFYQDVDDRPEQMFELMVHQCEMVRYVIVGLAHHLSAKSVDTVCRLIFSRKDLDSDFVDWFYVLFFPEYLQRRYSWFSLNLLYRAQVAWPQAFQKLLKTLFKNVCVPKAVLRDFVENLSSDKRRNLMSGIIEIDFTAEEFVHNIRTINAVFEDSDKSAEDCEFIFKNLEACSSRCYNNRGFGQLLHTLLVNLGDAVISQRAIKDIIDRHGSEYKAPCLAAFDDIIGEMVMQYQLQDFTRYFAKRFSKHDSMSL